MRCPSCGQESLLKDERFCEACGDPLNAGSENSDQVASPLASTGLPRTPPETSSADRFPNAGDTQNVKRGSARWRQLGWAAVAVVLYLSVADAAVETFLSQSPLRWWVVAAAVLYLALCVAVWRLMPKLWRRLSWANQAGFSLIVLLALMTVTAWMPGGLEQGLNLFRQPTSIVLAVVSAVVVALSGVFLVRLRFVPRAGKIAAGLLAAYGVMAFLWAVNAGTSYSSLFHGGSQWTRLPSWLQGATVGCLFLVPLALLLEIVIGLRQITRDRTSDFAFRVVALGMSVMITVAAIRIPADRDSERYGTPTWLRGGHEELLQGEAGYKLVSEKLNRMHTALDVVGSKMDRSLFEIDALAARLGPDPAAIFQFVRDQIRYEPYTGVLRGAVGTLLCRAGNSLDRSLLLAALLEKAGLTTQIASGQLTAEQARILVNRLFEPIRSVPRAVPTLAELAPDLTLAIGVDQPKLLRIADEVHEYGERQKTNLVHYVDIATSDLSNLLNKAGVDAGVITPNDQLQAEASEHYWVQYQNSDGKWLDLDSAFSDAEPGKTAVSATNTFASNAVPEELYHHLHISLTLRVAQVEDGNDSSTDDTLLLDQDLRVAEQQGKDISLANVPVPAPDMANRVAHPGDALAATRGYQTIIQIGTQTVAGKYFDLDGRGSNQLGGPAGAAGGVGGSLGGLGGGIGGSLGGDTSQGATTRIVGEWVDYKLTSPVASGRPPIVKNYHRDIIAPLNVKSWTVERGPETVSTNLGKEALRRRLFWSTDLLPVTGAIVVDYPGYLATKSFSENRDSIDALAKIAFGMSQTGTFPGLSNRPPITNLLLAQSTMQQENNLRTRFASVTSYFGGPALIAYETATSETSDRLKRGYDIITFPNRVVGNPASPSDGIRRDASSLHLLGGVLATRLEWALMASDPNHSETEPSPLNATRVFDAAKKDGVPLVVLRPGVDSLRKLADTSLSESVKAELSATLATGDDVVVPVSPLLLDGRQQVAWWRFEPASGQVRGVMPGGRGQAMEEWLQAAWVFLSFVACFWDYHTSEEPLGTAQEKLAGCVLTAVVFGQGAPSFMYEEWVTFYDITSVVIWHAVS
jgi:hypothetical protein